MQIIQFYQHNGKLLVPYQKQGNYPVIPIYVMTYIYQTKCEMSINDIFSCGSRVSVS